MNPRRRPLITALAAAGGLALLTAAALSSGWNVQNTVRNWGAAIAQKLAPPFQGHSSTALSMRLEETSDHYTVALRLPGGGADRVRVELKGRTLHIGTPGGPGTVRQAFTLADADPSAVPAITRGTDAGRLTVTVPKTKALSGPSARWPFSGVGGSLFSNLWDDPFPGLSPLSGVSGWSPWQPFEEDSLSGFREEDGRYIAELRFPGCTLEHVDAGVHDRTLTVEARGVREDSGKDREHVSGTVRLSRTMTLPGPVNPAGMRLETNGDRLTVIVPKAPSPDG